MARVLDVETRKGREVQLAKTKTERKKNGMKIGKKERHDTRYTRERMWDGRTVWHGPGRF